MMLDGKKQIEMEKSGIPYLCSGNLLGYLLILLHYDSG